MREMAKAKGLEGARMNAKNFLARPENLLNLSFVLLAAAQVSRVADALGEGKGLLTGIQISLLIGSIVVGLLYIRHRKRRPYPIKLEGHKLCSCTVPF